MEGSDWMENSLFDYNNMINGEGNNTPTVNQMDLDSANAFFAGVISYTDEDETEFGNNPDQSVPQFWNEYEESDNEYQDSSFTTDTGHHIGANIQDRLVPDVEHSVPLEKWENFRDLEDGYDSESDEHLYDDEFEADNFPDDGFSLNEDSSNFRYGSTPPSQ